VRTSSYTHHHPNVTMCKAKAVCNYAVSILANQEATHEGYEEAMLLDPQGFLCQARARTCHRTATARCTRPTSRRRARGITRANDHRVRAGVGIPVVERRISRDEVYIADEAFFTGTAAEVTPIREYDNRRSATAGAARSPRACSRCSSTR